MKSAEGGTALVSVTRVRPKGWRDFATIVRDSFRSRKQLRSMPGFFGGYLAVGPGFAMWTVTVWKNEASMLAFRNSGEHLKAMPKLIDSCSEASFVHWTADEIEIPSPGEAAARMTHGRTSKLRHPAAAHLAGDPWPDRKVPWRGPRLTP